jgi:hypothetical protein
MKDKRYDRIRLRLTPMAYQIYQNQAAKENVTILDVVRREWSTQPAQQLDLVVEDFLKPLATPEPKNLASTAHQRQKEAPCS